MEKENKAKTNLSSPKISCIVPVYNVEKYLNRCVDSILSQSFTDFELILIDDGSPDNCGKICDEYAEKDSRIKVIHKPNGGVSSARNAGLDAAYGEYVCFVDSDDWVEADYIECLYNMITESKCDVAVCGFVGEKHRKPKVLNRENAMINIFSQKGYGGFSQKKIFSLALVNAVPKTRYDEKIKFLEDSEFFYRLFQKCNSVYWDNIPLYHYEFNRESASRQIGISENHRSAYTTLERLIENESNKKIKRVIKVNHFNFRTIRNLLYFYTKKTLTKDEEVEFNFERKTVMKCWIYNIFSFRNGISLNRKILTLLILFMPKCILKRILIKRYGDGGRNL